MFNFNKLGKYSDADLQELYRNLSKDEIKMLVDNLDMKASEARYQSLQLLKFKSYEYDDVYSYIDVFIKKLNSKDSTQRSIGCILIAANAKWDNHKIDDNIDLYLSITEDEKPITSIQCIQSLLDIVPYKEKLWDKVIDKLININIKKIKDTMRKLVVINSINILKFINQKINNNKINDYFNSIVKNNLFDEKKVKEIQKAIIG